MLSTRQHFLHYKSIGNFFRCSRTSSSEMNSPIWSEIKLVRDNMAVLVTCQYDEKLIKNEVAFLRTRSNMGFFFGTKGQVTPKLIKNEVAFLQTRSNMVFFWHLRASNSKVNIPIWPEFELRRDLCLSWLRASLMKI